MLKNIIISVLSLLLLANVVSASTGLVINPLEYIGNIKIGHFVYGHVFTTKVKTPEGTYRLFVSSLNNGGGISALKVK